VELAVQAQAEIAALKAQLLEAKRAAQTEALLTALDSPLTTTPQPPGWSTARRHIATARERLDEADELVTQSLFATPRRLLGRLFALQVRALSSACNPTIASLQSLAQPASQPATGLTLAWGALTGDRNRALAQTPRSLQDGGSEGGHSYDREAHAAATTIQAFVRGGRARAEASERRRANAVLAEFNARWAGIL